jgi:hypothetical protein
LIKRVIISFFQNKRFDTYWYDSGSSLLTSNIAQNKTDYFKVFNTDLTFSPPYPEMDLKHMNDTVVLMQAGYLTIKDINPLGIKPEYNLKIPNKEVLESIRLEILGRMMIPPDSTKPEIYLNEKYEGFLKAFGTRDEDECERLLSTILSGITQRGSGSPDDKRDAKDQIYEEESNFMSEFLFRSLLQLLIEFGNKMNIPESFSDIGRSDLVVETPNGEWVVIEIKYQKFKSTHKKHPVSKNYTETNGAIVIGNRSKFVNNILEKNINVTFNQIINKNYVKKFLAENTNVFAAAIAIYGSSDVMVRFKRIVWKNK